MTNYDFTGKSIKCETWEQMLHLAKLAEEQGYENHELNREDFERGFKVFSVASTIYTHTIGSYNPITVPYTDFINPPLPTETIEVTGCEDCPFHLGLVCLHPKQLFKRNHFTHCPLKQNNLIIQLKNNDTTGN